MPSHRSLCAAFVLALPLGGGQQPTIGAADRDDAANLALAHDLTAYQPPLTQQFANTGHLTDRPPLALQWRLGRNMFDSALGPARGEFFVKNAATCWLAADEIVVAGGCWWFHDSKTIVPTNSTFLYRPSTDSWHRLAGAPFVASRTTGACDPRTRTLYLISGLEAKCAGGLGCIAALRRGTAGDYAWRTLPGMPGGARSLGASGLLTTAEGQWLITAAGMTSGIPPMGDTGGGSTDGVDTLRQAASSSLWAAAKQRTGGRAGAEVLGYRMKLGGGNTSLRWEVTKAFPGGDSSGGSDVHHKAANDHTCLAPQSAVIGGSFYVFGGFADVPAKARLWGEMVTKWRLPITDTSGGCAVFHDSYRYDVLTDAWSPLPSPPFPVVSGGSVVLRERFSVLLGSAGTMSVRGGTISRPPPQAQLGAGHNSRPVDALDAALGYWSGYVRATDARSAVLAAPLISAHVRQGDQVLCFDTHTATWSRIGVLPYGLSTMQTTTNGTHIITFGGEPETHHHGSKCRNCSPPPPDSTHTLAAYLGLVGMSDRPFPSQTQRMSFRSRQSQS
jgi:hypothetical protein